MPRILALLVAIVPLSSALPQSVKAANGPRVGGVPLTFVENQGQWEEPARFITNMGRLAARFEPGAFLLCCRAAGEGVTVRFSFEVASDETTIEGESPHAGDHNFLVGHESTWCTGVRGCASIFYRGLYEGVDMLVHEHEGRLKYDVLLGRAADLERFVVRSEGAERPKVRENGDLVLTTSLGELTQPSPETWQSLKNGEKKTVECR